MALLQQVPQGATADDPSSMPLSTSAISPLLSKVLCGSKRIFFGVQVMTIILCFATLSAELSRADEHDWLGQIREQSASGSS